jgi:superfamily II DNA or RNA helicase
MNTEFKGYYSLDVTKYADERKDVVRHPFDHQDEAFAALSNTLPTPINGYKGTLLVLPTGGGKTFTSVNWICRHIVSEGIKVLWLAQSSYLIDQAAQEFVGEIHHATGRDIINLRVVSSNDHHSNSGSIKTTDDILICTTQTAVIAYDTAALDGRGNVQRTPFRKFIDDCKDNSLFIVVDEAHHVPAYGCRTLLNSIREEIHNLYLLGLTATPKHNDKRISGWLNVFFDSPKGKKNEPGISYEANKQLLEEKKILAVPKYIEKDTNYKRDVDDKLFDRLVYKHKDLPKNIIDELANNQPRNDFIVSDYLNNSKEYGKTLIFADRWFQCEYISEKLNASGVRADAVYSVVTGQNEIFKGGAGRRNDTYNRETMQKFKDGELDVMVNVKMLTEGVDVPDVKTVMITRDTTSSILFIQMVGRGVRGEKAGGGEGKDSANIVLFHDTWTRHLPWVMNDGGIGGGSSKVKPRKPMSLVSIHLVKRAIGDIEYKGFENAPYLTFIPVGYFDCKYTSAVVDDAGEEWIPFTRNVVAYEFDEEEYRKLIKNLKKNDLTKYEKEDLDDELLIGFADDLAREYFKDEKDGFDGQLTKNISDIVRHIAQNRSEPPFISFAERNVYDLDRIAKERVNLSMGELDIDLRNMWGDSGLLWQHLYKNYDTFWLAFMRSLKRVMEDKHGEPQPPAPSPVPQNEEDLTPEMKKQVLARDHNTCLCCGKKRGEGVALNIDHIIPVAMGGGNTLSNLQTLCRICNSDKGVNTIDYRVHNTPLGKPKENYKSPPVFQDKDTIESIIARTVNTFYHCAALMDFKRGKRRDSANYKVWDITLYDGNDPEWFKPYVQDFLDYIHSELTSIDHVDDIRIHN